MNEAALLAARRHGRQIRQKDLEDAVEKVVAGPERKSCRLGEEEKRRVAYHETGHALVAAYSRLADPVHKISVIPRGRAALGYTLQAPTGDRFLMTRNQLLERIRGLLGGRAAEDVVFGEVTTGAENDLEHATALARQMVCIFGMSETVGLARCAQKQNGYLQVVEGGFHLDCSEQTAREVDGEVKQILNDTYNEAKRILLDHREDLERVTHRLLQDETIDAETFDILIGRRPAEHRSREHPVEVAPKPPSGQEGFPI